MKRNLFHSLLVCVFAFLGGLVSERFLHPSESHASAEIEALNAQVNNMVQVIYDKDGKRRIDLDASRGSPLQDFYGDNGNLRLQLGTYSNPAEAGLPLVGWSDTRGHLRMLMRLSAGANQSPVLVMKDSKGNDRVVFGTSSNDEGEEPFLAYFDKYNVKHMVFGRY